LGLPLRRAISIQAEGKELLENYAIAPSAKGFVGRRWGALSMITA